ncbi:hypothetical protein BT69DRAFT_370522 [Atractiella rhizophila]|nr:hypothetical protein BT69DRAFT_370522 [Atractiella rhizophila]
MLDGCERCSRMGCRLMVQEPPGPVWVELTFLEHCLCPVCSISTSDIPFLTD